MPCVVVFCTLDGDAELLVRDLQLLDQPFIPQCHTATFTIEDVCTIYGCIMLLSVFYTLKLTSGLTFTFFGFYSLCKKCTY